MASVYREKIEGCMGFRQREKRKEWTRADTWNVIDNRRTLKTKLTDAKSERLCKHYQQQCSEANRG